MSYDARVINDSLHMYMKSLNISICTKALDERNYDESAMESTNVLQEEDHKEISLGMPKQPQEEEVSAEKMKHLMTVLNDMAYYFCDIYNASCCMDQSPKHF